MNKVGIIAAMQEELDEIIKIMTDTKKETIYEIEFLHGKIQNKEVIAVKSGIGKVNAGRTTQILIDKYNVDNVINVGSAGALNPEINIGDIVIGDKLIQHDFDITAFNHEKGFITGVGDYLCSDIGLIEKFENTVNILSNNEYKITKGVIASGDIFCTEIKMKEKIFSKFNAQCVEMEGAAIAQVCYLDKVPFIVIRSISDSPNGKNAMVFDEFLKLASKKCAYILNEFFKD